MQQGQILSFYKQCILAITSFWSGSPNLVQRAVPQALTQLSIERLMCELESEADSWQEWNRVGIWPQFFRQLESEELRLKWVQVLSRFEQQQRRQILFATALQGFVQNTKAFEIFVDQYREDIFWLEEEFYHQGLTSFFCMWAEIFPHIAFDFISSRIVEVFQTWNHFFSSTSLSISQQDQHCRKLVFLQCLSNLKKKDRRIKVLFEENCLFTFS